MIRTKFSYSLLFFLFVNSITYFSQSPFIVVLGTTQDAGSPQIGCIKKCCSDLFKNPDPSRNVVSLGIVDSKVNKFWMIESTPDFITQSKTLKEISGFRHDELPDGIFITHAHIGHYTGLMYLGRESVSSKKIPVYTMSRMKGFLMQNGPWNQLINLNNISIVNMDPDQSIQLSNDIQIIPFLVPHRDEFSETVGFKIMGPNKSILFIPDIDKWGKWNKDLAYELKTVDAAFIDGTFYDSEEINHRNMAEIPHPFVVETMQLFDTEDEKIKSKLYFTHLNHTNPLLDTTSKQYREVILNGFSVSTFKQIVNL